MAHPPYFKVLQKDPALKPLLKAQGPIILAPRTNVFLRLCASVLSQQLSTKVARVIQERFLNLFDGEPDPIALLAIPEEQLRGIGLSGAKARYVHAIATYACEQDLSDERLEQMSNEAIMELLLPIKGVGRWTVEMLLMFTLAREDVFAVDDLGIQHAMIRLYGWQDLDKKTLRARMLEQSAQWAPYRTYACLHLWRHKDS
jgi:DNA-3-methyladenine glycosylase II